MAARRWLLALVMLIASAVPATADSTVRVAITQLPASQGNPYRTATTLGNMVLSAMFDGLTTVAADGKVEPALATAWEQTSPRTWKITLRQGVKFSNGEVFDADAVLAAIAYLTSEAARIEPVARELESIESAKALDDFTIEITTRGPNPVLDRELAALRVAAPRAWAELGPEGFARAPVGTGPFKVVRWDAQRVILEANPGAFRKPSAARLELLAIPDAAGRLQALLAGQADVALGLSPELKDAIESSGARLEPGGRGVVYILGFDIVKPGPLQDKRVREAINLAVDKQRLVDTFLDGRAAIASQPATAFTFGYDPTIKPFPYDPARAKALLVEAGFPNGLTIAAEAAVDWNPNDRAIMQQVIADLASAGITLRFRQITLQEQMMRANQGGWTSPIFGSSYNVTPPLDALRSLKFHSCLQPNPWFCDREIQPLIDRALAAETLAERETLTRQVVRAYHEAASALYLHDVVEFNGLSARVEGFAIANGWIFYERLSLRP